MCIVQYLAASCGVEAIGSYPKEYTALHIALDNTILSQNGLLARQNKWILLAPGSESHANNNLSAGGHVLILFFHKNMIALFQEYFEKDISYPKSSVINLYAENAQTQRMIELASQTKQYGNGDVPQHIVKCLAVTFLEVLMTRVYVGSERAPKKRYHKVKVFNFLRDYIHANYSQPITMQDLYAKANVTHRTMDRLFKDELGMSPLKYLLVCRLGAVREQLANPDCSKMEISTIAQDCGFSHLGRFSHYFKQHYGVSPREFRKHINLESR
jgi:AraC-like DNA-binding protein